MNKIIRIGTYKTDLAAKQAATIAELIKPSGYTPELVFISPHEAPESKLLKGSVDMVAHSAKYIGAELPDELELIAFSERKWMSDVIISTQSSLNLKEDTLKFGASSARGVAFLRHFYPLSKTTLVQGTFQSRIKKLKNKTVDALLLAHEDVVALGFENHIIETLDTSYFVPAVGQGSIGLVCHKKLSFDKKEVVQRWVNHEETEDCIRAERAFLKLVQGTSKHPVFGFAQFEGNLITLKAGIISPDGKQVIKVKRSSTLAESKELGKKIAIEVLANGGDSILKHIQ
jgi:hydroxymethylbilane synthase